MEPRASVSHLQMNQDPILSNTVVVCASCPVKKLQGNVEERLQFEWKV